MRTNFSWQALAVIIGFILAAHWLAACDFGYDRPGANPDAGAKEGEGVVEGEPSEGEGVVEGEEGEGEPPSILEVCSEFCGAAINCLEDSSPLDQCVSDCAHEGQNMTDPAMRKALECIRSTSNCDQVKNCLDRIENCVDQGCAPYEPCPEGTTSKCYEDECGCPRDCQCIPNGACDGFDCQEPPSCPNDAWPACQYDKCGCPFNCQCPDPCAGMGCAGMPACPNGTQPKCDYDQCGCPTACECGGGGNCDNVDCAPLAPCPNGSKPQCSWDECGCPYDCVCGGNCDGIGCGAPAPCADGSYPQCNYDECGCPYDCYCANYCDGVACAVPPPCPNGQYQECKYDECGCPLECFCQGGGECKYPPEEAITGPEAAIYLINMNANANSTIYISSYWPIQLGEYLATGGIAYFSYQWDCGICNCQDAMLGYGCPVCDMPQPALIEIPPGAVWTTYWTGLRFAEYQIPPNCAMDPYWGGICQYQTQADQGRYVVQVTAATDYAASWGGSVERQDNGDGTYTIYNADLSGTTLQISQDFDYPTTDVKVGLYY